MGWDIDAEGERENDVQGEEPAGARHSRRALMTGLAAGAGIAASMVIGAEPAAAGTDGDVVLGAANSASAATSISNTGVGNAFTATGVTNGAAGVLGVDNSTGGGGGYGVQGTSTNGTGVQGTTSGDGRFGFTKGILMPIYQTAHYQVRAEGVQDVVAAIEEFVSYVTSSEPGTVMYTAWQEKDDPTRFVHLFNSRTTKHRRFTASQMLSGNLRPFTSPSSKAVPHCSPTTT
jgi:hypothetical protein